MTDDGRSVGETVDAVIAALADPTRRKVLDLIAAQGEAGPQAGQSHGSAGLGGSRTADCTGGYRQFRTAAPAAGSPIPPTAGAAGPLGGN